MKIISIILLIFISFNCVAKTTSDEKSPWAIELGIGNIEILEFRHRLLDIRFQEDTLLLGLSYRFNESFRFNFTANTNIDCGSCGGVDQLGSPNWIEADYDVTFYQLGASYLHQFDAHSLLTFPFGLTIADDKLDINECNFIRWDDKKMCLNGTTIYESEDNRYSLYAGIGMSVNFSTSWAVNAQYTYNTYRDGALIFNFSIGYFF